MTNGPKVAIVINSLSFQIILKFNKFIIVVRMSLYLLQIIYFYSLPANDYSFKSVWPVCQHRRETEQTRDKDIERQGNKERWRKRDKIGLTDIYEGQSLSAFRTCRKRYPLEIVKVYLYLECFMCSLVKLIL